MGTSPGEFMKSRALAVTGLGVVLTLTACQILVDSDPYDKAAEAHFELMTDMATYFTMEPPADGNMSAFFDRGERAIAELYDSHQKFSDATDELIRAGTDDEIAHRLYVQMLRIWVAIQEELLHKTRQCMNSVDPYTCMDLMLTDPQLAQRLPDLGEMRRLADRLYGP